MSWRRISWGLASLLVLLSLPDLFSPPISPTILRQTQTFSQTTHFVAAGFSPAGLTIDIDGPKPFHVVYEFPLYQGIVGFFFKIFGPAVFWGKIVSLAATVSGFWLALQLARRAWGPEVAWRAGFFLAVCPITLLVSAAFQPDALALALGAGAGIALLRWRADSTSSRWIAFLLVLLASALAKFTVLVPFLPLLVAAVFRRDGRWRWLAARNWMAAIGLFAAPFVAWNLYRGSLMDPRYLVDEDRSFLIGDLTRFLHARFYLKPAFILGAMVLCGTGIPLVLTGLRRLDSANRLLVAGVPLYFILIPTAADQTYYAWPLVPVLALLAAHGALAWERHFLAHASWLRAAIATAWLAGFAVVAPYTLRHDRVSAAAASAVRNVSAKNDLLLVLNMHDRGVGIGGFNPTIVTLAERRGWNARFSTDAKMLRSEIEAHRQRGARWLVVTWFTPEQDPWFVNLLPGFTRCPQVDGKKVDGEAVTAVFERLYPVAIEGANFAVLQLATP